MATLLTGRTKVAPRAVLPCSVRTPAEMADRDGWPIRETARVTCRRNGKRVSGTVLGTFKDHRDREMVEVSTTHGLRLFRPHECRVQRG